MLQAGVMGAEKERGGDVLASERSPACPRSKVETGSSSRARELGGDAGPRYDHPRGHSDAADDQYKLKHSLRRQLVRLFPFVVTRRKKQTSRGSNVNKREKQGAMHRLSNPCTCCLRPVNTKAAGLQRRACAF